MHLGIRVRSISTDTRIVDVVCPECGVLYTEVEARDLKQIIYAFYVIPIFFHHPTFVSCPRNHTLISALRCKDLAGLDPQFASKYLRSRISPILKTLVLGGLFTWMIPWLGPFRLCGTYLWARKYSGWVRSLAGFLFFASLLQFSIFIWAVYISTN